jgi:hypothetical protein
VNCLENELVAVWRCWLAKEFTDLNLEAVDLDSKHAASAKTSIVRA